MFRRNYSVEAQAQVASPTKTIAVLTTGGTQNQPCIYDMWLGSSASPADNAITWYLQRTSAAGTTTSYTPVPLNPGLGVSVASAGVIATGEPTYITNKYLFHLALNQRASHRCQFDPEGPLVIPVTANNGIGIFPVHASFTGNVDMTFHFYE